MSTTDFNRTMALDLDAARKLAERLVGDITCPGDADYDSARAVWNGMIDRYPAIIVHCEGTQDVVSAVSFAREQNLTVAVRGGGHSVAGHGTCDGGVVIDLERMKGIAVDPASRTATAQAGVTWADLDAATQEHGLVTPGGVFSDTGIAGLTLGGGFGWIRNTFGLSCDNLIGAEVVLADGRVVRAEADQNPDLLWGLRGGGGNFGIVTSFKFQLHELGPQVMMAFVMHSAEGDRTREAVKYFVDYTATAPDEVSAILACGVVPPEEELFPKEIHYKPFVLFGGLYAGPVEDGQRVLQPLLDFGEPLVDLSGVMPYVDAQKLFDEDYPDGLRYYWKSLSLNRIDDDVINRFVEHAREQPSPFSTTDLWHNAGAVRKIGAKDAAFFGRQALFLLNVEANWEDPDDDVTNIRWAREFIASMEEFSDGSRYLNFAGFQEEGDAMMRGAYGPHYERLVALKTKYDPTNFFALNQNVKPAR